MAEARRPRRTLLDAPTGQASPSRDAADAPASRREAARPRRPPPAIAKRALARDASTPTATSTSRRRSPTSTRLKPANKARDRARRARADAAPAHRRRAGRAARVEVRRRAGAADAGTSARSTSTSRRSCARASAPTSLTKLRRGHWSVQGELDLHGHDSRRGARRARGFPRRGARARRMRCVRVIHGKGLTSPEQGAGAQGQGAPLARALGRRARVLRSAAARRRRRRGARAAARADLAHSAVPHAASGVSSVA